jgi:glutathione S-transferase/GST-like protein
MVRKRDPEELAAAIDRIPLPERRVAWRKAINGDFSESEMAESRRRVALGIAKLEEELGKRDYVGSDAYSLADINIFNSTYSLPLSQPDLASREKTPNIMRWLKRVYERDAVKRTWAMGKTDLAARYSLVMEGIV